MSVIRFKENPLITPADVPPSRPDYEVIGAFNAGVTTYAGETLLLLRIAEKPKDVPAGKIVAPIFNPETKGIDHFEVDINAPEVDATDPRVFKCGNKVYLTSISHLRIATSKDGVNFKISETPAVFPETINETFGLEDPRITKIEDTYYITYKTVSDLGICTALLKTCDFINFERLGIILCPENLDVTIFPEKINGKYYALTRPVPHHIGPLAIWIASSNDLANWGNHKPLIIPRPGRYDSARVGASCVPIKTEKGWLEIYHGADENHRYCLAAALLDLNDPSKVLAYSKEPIMQPEAEYELNGFFGNVVFACGATCDNTGNVVIYYGASDETTAAAKTTISEILDKME